MPCLICGAAPATVGPVNRPTIAEQIKEARERAGLSQRELAELAGKLSQPNIARLESGEHSCTVETLQRIADALRVDIVIHWSK